MRAFFLISALALSAPAIADTDIGDTGEDTDTDDGSSDTDGVADTDGQTASESAGDPGGLACSTSATAAGLAAPVGLVGLLIVGRRRARG